MHKMWNCMDVGKFVAEDVASQKRRERRKSDLILKIEKMQRLQQLEGKMSESGLCQDNENQVFNLLIDMDKQLEQMIVVGQATFEIISKMSLRDNGWMLCYEEEVAALREIRCFKTKLQSKYEQYRSGKLRASRALLQYVKHIIEKANLCESMLMCLVLCMRG